MSKPSRRHYANLLAQKCLLSPSDAEIEALLELNLDIDWTFKSQSTKNLSELCFSQIKDHSLFSKWWQSFSKSSNISSAWDQAITDKDDMRAPYIAWGIYFRRSQALKEWLAQDNGTPQQWKELADNPVVQKTILRYNSQEKWDNFLDFSKGVGMDKDFIKSMDAYRKSSLWLGASLKSEFDELSPKKWSPEVALAWWDAVSKVFKQPNNVSKSAVWRMDALLEHKEAWKSWGNEHWEEFWTKQPPGVLLYRMPYSAEKTVDKAFLQSANWTNSTLWRGVLWHEVEALCATHDNASRTNYSYNWRGSSSSTSREYSVARPWVKFCMDKIQQMNANNTNNDNAWMYGLMQMHVDISAVRSTMFSDKCLGFWKHASMPETYEQMVSDMSKDVNGYPMLRNYEATLLSDAKLGSAVGHVLKTIENDPKKMQNFIASIPAHCNKTLANEFVQWGMRGAKGCSTNDGASAWAGLFWKFIFHLDSANQHNWLKKAAADTTYHTQLPFWNQDYQDNLEEIASRKRTKDINALLEKMTILNQTAQLVDLEEKTSKRRSKM